MSVDPEIFAIFQHKVVRVPHFAQVTEMRHILMFVNVWMCLFNLFNNLLHNLKIKKCIFFTRGSFTEIP